MQGGQRPLSAVVVAGTHSGVGKTTVAIGLIGALRRRGLVVQPFKVGPDFIDPLHHAHASGRPSRNLDGWMLTPQANRARFVGACADADVAVIEGVMGLFDGSDARSDRGSAAEMAKLLGVPVLLVVDASAMARSAAALIHGYNTFDPSLRLTGVVANLVGGEPHAQMIRDAVAGEVPVLGALPRVGDLVVPERHLGLHLPHEARAGYVERLAELIERHVDLDGLLGAAAVERHPPSRPVATPPPEVRLGQAREAAAPPPQVRLGLARDEAFCFYYADNLELLEQAGAELVEFSPLRDRLPGGLDGLYIGGGYPELHAAELGENTAARAGIRELAASGAPIYAECGGLMYLAQTLSVDGTAHPMCGLLPFTTSMPAGLTLAYVEIETSEGPFGQGHRARGHTYHHSKIEGEPRTAWGFRVKTSRGDEYAEGYRVGNVLASYVHLHFASEPQLPAAFVASCRRARDGARGTDAQ